MRILDLGSGSGRDCYIAAQLVGEKGQVVGVDMTDEQLQVAKEHLEWHRDKFGFENSNVTFVKGNLETLDQLGLEPNSFDLIILNCVINLVTDKEKVLNDAFNLLKEGGEMYFAEVYSDRRIPQNLKEDKTLWGECLSGALYWNDFLRFAKDAGFRDPRVCDQRPVSIENESLEQKVGSISFYSVTYRMFKLQELESDCEDYGQAVCYNGGLAESADAFDLDNHHHFPKGKIIPVCGNTFLMLNRSRFNSLLVSMVILIRTMGSLKDVEPICRLMRLRRVIKVLRAVRQPLGEEKSLDKYEKSPSYYSFNSFVEHFLLWETGLVSSSVCSIYN